MENGKSQRKGVLKDTALRHSPRPSDAVPKALHQKRGRWKMEKASVKEVLKDAALKHCPRPSDASPKASTEDVADGRWKADEKK